MPIQILAAQAHRSKECHTLKIDTFKSPKLYSDNDFSADSFRRCTLPCSFKNMRKNITLVFEVVNFSCYLHSAVRKVIYFSPNLPYLYWKAKPCLCVLLQKAIWRKIDSYWFFLYSYTNNQNISTFLSQKISSFPHYGIFSLSKRLYTMHHVPFTF